MGCAPSRQEAVPGGTPGTEMFKATGCSSMANAIRRASAALAAPALASPDKSSTEKGESTGNESTSNEEPVVGSSQKDHGNEKNEVVLEEEDEEQAYERQLQNLRSLKLGASSTAGQTMAKKPATGVWAKHVGVVTQ